MTGPCPRPECGSEIHTDGWGTPIRCPRACSHTLNALPHDAHDDCPGWAPDDGTRRAREALGTDEASARCPSCEHRWDIHSDDGCWHTVTHGRSDRDLVCACRVPRKEQL